MVSIQRDSHPRINTYRHTAPTYEPHDDQYYRYGFPDCNNGEANAKRMPASIYVPQSLRIESKPLIRPTT